MVKNTYLDVGNKRAMEEGCVEVYIYPPHADRDLWKLRRSEFDTVLTAWENKQRVEVKMLSFGTAVLDAGLIGAVVVYEPAEQRERWEDYVAEQEHESLA